MRVSAGLAVIGLSGKTRIHTLPPRFMKRVSAIRAASIWRASNQHGSNDCKPNSPKARVLPRWAVPLIRPRCCLRYLYRDGASNMASILLYSLSLAPVRLAALVESAVPESPAQIREPVASQLPHQISRRAAVGLRDHPVNVPDGRLVGVLVAHPHGEALARPADVMAARPVDDHRAALARPAGGRCAGRCAAGGGRRGARHLRY